MSTTLDHPLHLYPVSDQHSFKCLIPSDYQSSSPRSSLRSARGMPPTSIKLPLLLALAVCILLALKLPVYKSSDNTIEDFHQGVISRIRYDLRNGNAIYGVAPQTGFDGCKSFTCPIGYSGVRMPMSADNVTKDWSNKNVRCFCVPKSDAITVNDVLRAEDINTIKKKLEGKRQTNQDPISSLNFTYIPPPKTDITPDLLAESLRVQPQDTATIGSIMPYFQDGVISFGVQLNGLVAATMTLNASVSLPCADIGASDRTQPDLVLRPKDIDNGTAQAYIPDCNIVAVNMYDPNIVHYWVMNPQGVIFSLVGSNKLMQINQLNSTASTSLVLRTIQSGTAKRDIMSSTFRDSNEIAKRALSQPNLHTALMTAEACAAMRCTQNGGEAAVFNPFTKTCWCRDPVYVEVEHT